MSDGERSSATLAVDKLVAEAKEHLENSALTKVDWGRVEAGVMAAVEREKPALHDDVVSERSAGRAKWFARSRDRILGGAALAVAAAAVFVLVRKDRDAVPIQPASSTEGASASALRTAEPSADGDGSGEVRVGGVVATPGHVLHGGEAVDVKGARAIFERPGKVTWLLEQESSSNAAVAHARVKSAGEPLVLGLEHGAIEAQVVPVPVGEAFAVDVATDRSLVRVAVHGTHLRVARAGNHVVVDLTEGVVSIGAPLQAGVTHETIVTAPAHVELDATDLGTLRIDHAHAFVRAAIPLGTHEVSVAREEAPSSPAHAATPSHAASTAHNAVGHGVDGTGAPAARVEPPKTAYPARVAIAGAVRECAAARARPSDVRVTVTSDLRLQVSPAGVVESAQFTPPLLPEIQTCAAQVIYRTKLDETGTVTIPIEYSY